MGIMTFIIIFVIGFCVGWIFFLILSTNTSAGELVLFEDEMYLNVSMRDAEKFKNNSFILLKVKRRNFNGFNGEK